MYQHRTRTNGAHAQSFHCSVARRCTIGWFRRVYGGGQAKSLSAQISRRSGVTDLCLHPPLPMNIPRQTTSPVSRHSHPSCHGRLTRSQATLLRRTTSPAPSHHNYPLNRGESHQHCPRRCQNRSSTAETASANASTSAKSSTRELVDDLLQRIGNSGQEQDIFTLSV